MKRKSIYPDFKTCYSINNFTVAIYTIRTADATWRGTLCQSS